MKYLCRKLNAFRESYVYQMAIIIDKVFCFVRLWGIPDGGTKNQKPFSGIGQDRKCVFFDEEKTHFLIAHFMV